MRAERKSNNQENELLRRKVVQLEEINKELQQSAMRNVSNQNDTATISQDILNKSNGSMSKQFDNNVPKFGENNDSQSVDSRRVYQSENSLQTNNNDLISGILKQFQALQINLTLPLFNPDSSNPVEFIRSFEKYCIRKNIVDDERLLIVEDALQGTAKIWFDTIAIPCSSFNEFKDIFLKEYFSIEARMQAKKEWEDRRFHKSDMSLQAYYNLQIKSAKVKVPRMEAYEINFIIIGQFPLRVRDILSTIDYADSERISKALARLDLSGGWDDERNRSNVNKGSGSGDFELNKPYNNLNKQNPRDGTNQSHRDNYRRTNANNWRDRENRQDNYVSGQQRRFADTSGNRDYVRQDAQERDTSNVRAGGSQNTNIEEREKNKNASVHVRTLQISKANEFIDTLCWDVEPRVEEGDINDKSI